MIGIFLILSSALPRQDAGMRELVDAWRGESSEVRQRASDRALSRWSEWSDEDLTTLDRAASDPDAEVATRAREASLRISNRRKLGPALVEKAPDLDLLLKEESKNKRFEVLERAGEIWRKKEVGDDALRRLADLALQERWTLDLDKLYSLINDYHESLRIRPYASLLATWLRDSSGKSRRLSAGLLGEIGAKEFAGEVGTLFTDAEPWVRAHAAAAFGKLAEAKESPKLLPLLEDLEPSVRAAAVEALSRLQARDAAPRLVPLLKDADPLVRKNAFAALAYFGALAREQILDALRDGAPENRKAAVEVLYWQGRASNQWPWTKEIAALLEDPDRGVVGEAMDYLRDAEAREYAPKIASFLKTPALRQTVLQILTKFEAKEYAPEIARLLPELDGCECCFAVDALVAFGAKEHAGAIVQALGKGQYHKNRYGPAAQGLLKLGASDQAEAVARHLDDESVHARLDAVHLLSEWDARDFVDRIVPRVGDPEPLIRAEAMETLLRLRNRDLWNQWKEPWEIQTELKSLEEKKTFLQGKGIRIDSEEDLRVLYLTPGIAASTMERLRMIPLANAAKAWIPDGAAARIVTPEEALEFWKGRLEQR